MNQRKINLPTVYDSRGQIVPSNRQLIVHLVGAPTRIIPRIDFEACCPSSYTIQGTAAVFTNWTMGGSLRDSSQYFNPTTGAYTVQSDDNNETFTVQVELGLNYDVNIGSQSHPALSVLRNGARVQSTPLTVRTSGSQRYVPSELTQAVFYQGQLNTGDQISVQLMAPNPDLANILKAIISANDGTFEMSH